MYIVKYQFKGQTEWHNTLPCRSVAAAEEVAKALEEIYVCITKIVEVNNFDMDIIEEDL